MSYLNTIDLKILEEYFQMGGGHVLDFTNQTFQQAIFDFCGEDIYSENYADLGNSKGKRLRCFFSKASKTNLNNVVSGLFDYTKAFISDRDTSKEGVIETIITNLGGSSGSVSQNNEQDFLKREFPQVNFSDLSIEPSFIETLELRWQEVVNCRSGGCPNDC